jgi:hypothetical protein
MKFTSVSELRKISAIAKQKRDEEIIAKQEEHKKYVFKCLVKLSKTYEPLIMKALISAAEKGDYSASVSFPRADFQLAYFQLGVDNSGTYNDLIKMIITEDTKFEGLKFSINPGSNFHSFAFSAHFSW